MVLAQSREEADAGSARRQGRRLEGVGAVVACTAGPRVKAGQRAARSARAFHRSRKQYPLYGRSSP